MLLQYSLFEQIFKKKLLMTYIPKIIKPGFARRMHLLHILLLLQNTKSINTKISLFHKTKTQTYIIYQIFSKSRHLNWQFSEEKKNCKKILSLKAPSINSLNLFLWKHGHLKSIDVSINYLCWKEQKILQSLVFLLVILPIWQPNGSFVSQMNIFKSVIAQFS